MGTLSLTVQKSTAEAIPYTVTIADEDIDRVASAYGSILFPQGVLVPQVVDEAFLFRRWSTRRATS